MRAKRPNERDEGNLEIYDDFWPKQRNQGVRLKGVMHATVMGGNFRIKLFYPKIGGHVFTPNFGMNHGNMESKGMSGGRVARRIGSQSWNRLMMLESAEYGDVSIIGPNAKEVDFIDLEG